MNDPPDKSLCFPLFDASYPRGRARVSDLLHRKNYNLNQSKRSLAFGSYQIFSFIFKYSPFDSLFEEFHRYAHVALSLLILLNMP